MPQLKTMRDETLPGRPVPRHVAVLGPTASGKSEVALRVARALQGEIVSCDSMQVYRELSIGTGKPTRRERERVHHHLVDALSMHDEWNTKAFVKQAGAVLRQLAVAGRPAVLVGGTGLYAQALIYGLSLQPSDRAVYRDVEAAYHERGGPRSLRTELRRAAPSVPQAVLENPRRLIRAIEILRIAGSYPSPDPDVWCGPPAEWQQYVLLPPRDEHKARIRRRVHGMLRTGWIEETRRLMRGGLFATPTARQALGYGDVAAFLRGDIRTEAELAQILVRRTLKYARRQRTWFRRQHPGSYLLTLQHGIEEAAIAAAIVAEWHGAQRR